MARKARVEFAGAVYHLLDRDDRQEAIFGDDTDRQGFLKTLGQVCARTGWRVHAFVLMTNHYHLLVETPEANLVAGMRWFQTTWTMRYNRRHRLAGHLLQGRYKSVVVDPEERDYAVILSDYIHLNPIRAGLIKLGERLFDFQDDLGKPDPPFQLAKKTEARNGPGALMPPDESKFKKPDDAVVAPL